MRWLFLILFVIAVLFFLTLSGWVAAGYVLVLLWTAGLLYLIFYRSDEISAAVNEITKTERR